MDNNIGYLMLEGTYIKSMGREIKSIFEEDNNSDLFPFDWYSLDEKARIAILDEAITKGIKIIQTEEYSKFCEGVVPEQLGK